MCQGGKASFFHDTTHKMRYNRSNIMQEAHTMSTQTRVVRLLQNTLYPTYQLGKASFFHDTTHKMRYNRSNIMQEAHTMSTQTRVVRLLQNTLYPTYQLHATMSNKQTTPTEGLFTKHPLPHLPASRHHVQ